MPRSGHGKPSGLHRTLYRMAAYVLFNRITIRRSDTATAPQPILFVGLHRNGALDGVPYLQAAPEATYLISAQLHRSALMRALMPGIASLEATGVNVDSEQILRAVEALAFAGTLGTDHSYAQNLKRLERNIPTELRTNLEEVWNTARWSGAWLFQELPLVPSHSLLRESLELLLLFPLVAAVLVLNAPVCLLASWASRRLPDDLNVVAFWRAAVGLPAAGGDVRPRCAGGARKR